MIPSLKRFFMGILSLLFLSLSSCGEGAGDSIVNKVSRNLELDLSAGTIISCEDTHGGFHGDGDTYFVMEFAAADGDTLEAEIDNLEHWHLLPMSKNVAEMAYGEEKNGIKSCAAQIVKDGENFFPDISEGYYFFCDRHSQSTVPYDDTELFQRYSFNFTLALYDSENDLLYYYEKDT